jgi:putative radical SAM enzyme (TIGR03279 family)
MTNCEPVGRIATVAPGSIAEELELQPGDLLLAVNGAAVADYIAYRFAIADEVVTLAVARDGECWEIEIEKEVDEDLGIGFEEDVFDGMRRCANRCVFCFEEQMPAGMRSSLSARDDDFRLSFLHGNFITLTNLRPGEWERILREHLTPLYVSVHATDPEVRRRMIHNRRAGEILPQLRQLGEAGIEAHTQIVLCPGWNDGAVLERTLDDLTALYPTVISVGVVPVGLTGHRPKGPEVRPVSPADADAALAAIERRQAELLGKLGTRLIFAADEFYLATGRPIPPAEAYEGYPQRENGIGLTRIFLDELAAVKRFPAGKGRKLTIATGALATPPLELLADRLRAAGWQAEVIPVPNHFYGGGVNVAGLLTGQDILAALRGKELGEMVLLPSVVLNADGVLLDDLAPEELEWELRVKFCFCAGPEEVRQILR